MFTIGQKVMCWFPDNDWSGSPMNGVCAIIENINTGGTYDVNFDPPVIGSGTNPKAYGRTNVPENEIWPR